MTYTGTSPTCALDISDPGTGEELEFVSGLGGGGFQRVFLDTSVDDISLVYIAGVIGCRNGRVEIGPDGELPEVSEASLDPDGDGFYYVHSGQGESEAFVVPDTFRVTYTGTSPTCALDIANPRTGAQYEFVSGLGGGGFQRVFLDSDLNLVYVADIIGCRGGRVEIGPDGELPEVSEASLDPDGDGFYYVHSGQGESEAFVVPDTFRVTYTGTSPTCALDIANPRTGAQYEFVSGLGGGGFERVFLDSDLNLVYVADIIGCRGGRLEFVPNS